MNDNLSEQIAPGVRGYTMETDRGLYIPIIMAEHEGSGDVGRYLDSLPSDRRVVVPDVLSPKLAGMLERRGFRPSSEWAAEFGEWVEVYERPPGNAPPPSFVREATA